MGKINHLLVIRTSAMGDVAMTVPVILALRASYPELQITILTNDFFAPMFSQISKVNVKHWDKKGKHKGLLGIQKLYQELLQLKIDAVADLHQVLRTNILKSFFLFNKISFVSLDKGRAEKKALTAWKPKSIFPLKTSHERYADVFEKLGLNISFPKGTFFLKREQLSSNCNQITGINTRKWIGIAPFAAHEAKAYSWTKMTSVIQELNDTGAYSILLFGGGSKEKKLLDALSAKLDNVTSIAGKISFAEELKIISNLDLMLSMDSGNGHLAAMYGVPVITIWGVTHPCLGFAPYKQVSTNNIIPSLNTYPYIPTSVYGKSFPMEYDDAISSISYTKIIEKISENLA